MKGRKLGVGEVPPDIMEEILQGIRCMTWGEAVLVAQDGARRVPAALQRAGAAPGKAGRSFPRSRSGGSRSS